jgi:hypothetical protein
MHDPGLDSAAAIQFRRQSLGDGGVGHISFTLVRRELDTNRA